MKGENNYLTLYFMRHGETILNKSNRTQGWCDGVLTEKGLEYAHYAGRGLKDVDFKSVYSSDLMRAVKTANIIIRENKNSDNIKLNELEGLREVSFGKYEAEKEYLMMNDILKKLNMKSFEQAEKKEDFQKAFCDACADLDETKTAENYETALSRVLQTIKVIANENYEDDKCNNVLVVLHGGILRLILDYLDKGLDLRNIDNLSISKILYDGEKFEVISVNDTSYLKFN